MGPLVQSIIDTGTPTVVVYSSGKPISEPWISNSSAALIQQFYPSEEGGNALADVLYGKVNPSGKLSVSFPHDVGSLPIYYDYLTSGRPTDPGYAGTAGNDTLVFGHQYVFGTPQPLYEFGYGLSYSNFSYSNVTLDKTTAGAHDVVTASVSVANPGTMDGMEVVQAYVQDVLSSVEVPNLRLLGFKKVNVSTGASVDVQIPLNVSSMGLWDVDMRYVVEPGEFVVWVGRSSMDLRGNASFVVA